MPPPRPVSASSPRRALFNFSRVEMDVVDTLLSYEFGVQTGAVQTLATVSRFLLFLASQGPDLAVHLHLMFTEIYCLNYITGAKIWFDPLFVM